MEMQSGVEDLVVSAGFHVSVVLMFGMNKHHQVEDVRVQARGENLKLREA